MKTYKIYKTTDMLNAYRERIDKEMKDKSFVGYWGMEHIENILERLETLYQKSCECQDALILQTNLDYASKLCSGMRGMLGCLEVPYSFSCRCYECGSPSLILVSFGEWQREWGVPHFVCRHCIGKISDEMKRTAMNGT